MTNNINSNEKFCTRCGKKFIAVGREVICPECKAQAAEDAKRAAVMRAKRASWTGESVPVRISGRASTVIREYGAANNTSFAAALDALLKETQFVRGMEEMGVAWKDIEPYRSRRRDKHATEDAQDKQDAPQEVKQAQDGTQTAQAAKATSKATTSKATSKATSKRATAGKAGKKAC